METGANVAMPETPCLWEQNDLLGLSLPATPAAPTGPAAPAEPAVPAASTAPPAPLTTATEATATGATATETNAEPATIRRSGWNGERRPLPQRLLILDTETTGLSPREGQCIEVGAVLFHVPSRAVLSQVSFLLPCATNPAEAINGIPAAVSRLEQPWRSGLSCFEAMADAADAVVAHNAAFDRQWFGNGPLPRIERPWICSMEEIRWPADRRLRATPSVRDLALAYGVPVWAAHRALTDCIYLSEVLQRCDDLENLLEAALEPRRLYRAQVSYAERQRAREAGFRWNDPISGAWCRRLSEREAAALSFPVVPVEPDPPPGRLPRSA
jgi:DNA polymerase-3 subunit epsilon